MSGQAKESRDEELVRAAQMGGRAALEQLVERYARIVYAIAYARLRQHEAAEDLVQEVLLSVYLNLDKLRNAAMFGPWVSRIARNAACNWIDKGQRRSKLVAMVSLEEQGEQAEARRPTMEEQERDEAVRAAIFRLPVEQREMVLMRYIEGISAEDISRRTGMNARTVLRHLNRALAQMRESIESILTDSAPAMRAPRSTTVRALGVLGAASVLSVSAKSALAASETAVLAGKCAATVSAGVSLSAKALGLVKSAVAMEIAGGMIVGTGKVIAVVGLVGLTALGGAKFYNYNAHKWQGAAAEQSVRAAQVAPPVVQATPALSTNGRIPGRVYIEKNRSSNSGMQANRFNISVEGYNMQTLISMVYGMPRTRRQIQGTLPEDKYDLTLDLLPEQANSRKTILQQGFEQYFSIISRKEMREMDVFVMTAPNGAGSGMKPSSKGSNAGLHVERDWNEFAGTNMDLPNICGNLEEDIEKPVIDESGLRGRYDISLKYDTSNPQSIIAAAQKQLGLVLTPARRQVEVLIIENRKR